MQDFSQKKIVLGVSGGIAAYKAAILLRELKILGAEVQIVMTSSAQQFVTPLTFQALSGNRVHCELFDNEAELGMGHIELARWADYLLVAPATANCIAKFAQGLADDLLSTLYLATNATTIICPSMNKNMWEHPATQDNYQLLKERGVHFVGPNAGAQACGDIGWGRLSDANTIINHLRLLEVNNLLKDKTVLITAGCTQESIDPVRYIANHSSGKMGYALAMAAQVAGAKVTLISGPTQLMKPEAVNLISVCTAEEMFHEVKAHVTPDTIFISCAAVADYRPVTSQTQKIKKTTNFLSLELKKNNDILQEVALSKKALFVVGFAAETENVASNGQEKMEKKQLDMIVINQVGKNLGFASDNNAVTILTRNKHYDFPLSNKVRLAGEIIAIIAQNLQNAAT